MKDNLSKALAFLGKAAAIIAVIAKAGEEVMSLCED